MAYDEAQDSITLNADSSLAGYTGISGTPGAADPHYGKAQYRFVKIVGARTCGRATTGTGETVKIIGVCQSKPQVVGQESTIAIRGETLILTGGTFAAGALIATDVDGKGVVTTTVAEHVAIAIEASTVANSVTTVLLRTSE